jgi:hypothetical protein
MTDMRRKADVQGPSDERLLAYLRGGVPEGAIYRLGTPAELPDCG